MSRPALDAINALLSLDTGTEKTGFSDDKQSPSFDAQTQIEIKRYLENPTRSGIWQFEAKWNINSGISNYIWRELEGKFKGKEIIQIASGGGSIPLQVNSEQIEEFRDRVFVRASFLTSLFTHLCHLDGIATKIPKYMATDKVIFDLLDLKQLQSAYVDAYNYFKSEVYFEGFDPLILSTRAFQIRGGSLVVLESHVRSSRLLWVATNPAPLEKAVQFFRKIGKISEETVRPVYSPEEVVFAPYFLLLNIAFPFLIGDIHSKGLFERAFAEYSRNDFINCISTIGLISEDYLTQVYETFFREVLPKGLTLGQTYDLIHSSIGRRFHSELKGPTDFNPIYNNIRELLQKDQSDPSSVSNKELIVLIRSLLNGMKDDREYLQHFVSGMTKKTEAISCFPRYLRENLNELIRYRNAASHKTRIPIGPYEALRTVYCLISLYIWWDNENRSIDWKEDAETILVKSIERNSKIQSNERV